MNEAIHLGFEIGSGQPVEIPYGHTVFLGQTQQAGKTTALEAAAVRSGFRVLAFITKTGEASFRRVPRDLLHASPPYYQESVEWRNVRDLCEAVTEENWDRFQRTALRSVCRAGHFGRAGSKHYAKWPRPKTLADVLDNMATALEEASGTREWIFGNIHADLEEALDEIKPLRKICADPQLKIGINVVNLERRREHIQSLVVASMIRWVREHEKKVIIALPETWKFTDAQKRTAVGNAARHFIREGAAQHNFLWIDSQTISRLSGELLAQCQVWLFGVQKWSRELSHALDAMPDHYWPQRNDLQTLGKGEFLVCYGTKMYRTYVQPAWMGPAHAQAIALGEEPIESAEEIAREFERSTAS